MKITGYRVEHYLMKMDRLVGDANLPSGVEMLPGSILYLETDENVTGVSLGYGGGIEGLFGAIEGADPRETVALWIRMNDWLHKAGNEGAASASLSAIDVALWDIKAKLADEPLWRTLGAREGRVRAYASGLDYCLSDEELFAFYRRMAEQGIDTGKLKVGLDLKADLRRLGIMREALGIASSRPGLMIDANEYWSPKQAVRYVRQLEEHFDLIWVEEPARRWDYDGLRLVSQQVRAAVASGENLHNLADIYPLDREPRRGRDQCLDGAVRCHGVETDRAHGPRTRTAGLDDECAGQLHGADRGRAAQSQHDGSGRPGTGALPQVGQPHRGRLHRPRGCAGLRHRGR